MAKVYVASTDSVLDIPDDMTPEESDGLIAAEERAQQKGSTLEALSDSIGRSFSEAKRLAPQAYESFVNWMKETGKAAMEKGGTVVEAFKEAAIEVPKLNISGADEPENMLDFNSVKGWMERERVPGEPYLPPQWSDPDEKSFKDWYPKWAETLNLNKNPDAPEQLYDYRSAMKEGAVPEMAEDGQYHWPSKFKFTEEVQGVDHPNRYIPSPDRPGWVYDTVNDKHVFRAKALEQLPRAISETAGDFVRFLGDIVEVNDKMDQETMDRYVEKNILPDSHSNLIASGFFPQSSTRMEREMLVGELRGKRTRIARTLQGAGDALPKKLPGKDVLPIEATSAVIAWAPSMALTMVNPVAGGLLMFAQTAASEYKDLKDQGLVDKDPHRAIVTSLITAIPNSLIELGGTLVVLNAVKAMMKSIPAGKNVVKAVAAKGMTNYAKNHFASFVGRFLESTGAESSEEYFQQYPQEIAAIYMANWDKMTGTEIAQKVYSEIHRIHEAGTAAAGMAAVGQSILFGIPMAGMHVAGSVNRAVKEKKGKQDSEKIRNAFAGKDFYSSEDESGFVGYMRRLNAPPEALYTIIDGPMRGSTVTGAKLDELGVKRPNVTPPATFEESRPIVVKDGNPVGENTIVVHDYPTGAAQLQGMKSNILIRQTDAPTNDGRTLMVQFHPRAVGYGASNTPDLDQHAKDLYSKRDGYSASEDFWEIPTWQGVIAKNDPNADSYIVRDPEDAVNFIRSAGYKTVMFSVMDVTKDQTRKIAKELPGIQFIVGGYVDPSTFADLPNVKFFSTPKEMVESQGKTFVEGMDYRHFQGTETIPRLCLSDGCLHACAFCTIPKEIVPWSDASIDSQVESFKDLRFKYVYLNDKTFGQADNYRKLPELFEKIRQSNPQFKGFIIQTTAPAFLKLDDQFLTDSHIAVVELGMESFNDSILQKIHKPHNEKLLEKAAQRLRERKILFVPNVIVGLSGVNADGTMWSETEKTYQHTLDWLKANADIISHTNITTLALYDQTELGKQMASMPGGKTVDESAITRDYMTEPEVHEKFFKDIIAFNKEQLSKTPFAEDVTAAQRSLSKIEEKIQTYEALLECLGTSL